MLIKNGLVFRKNGSFEHLHILVENGRIVNLITGNPEDDYSGEVIDAKDCYVVPGLTDIHFHGCMGHDFCEGTEDAFEIISAYEFSCGVTNLCPATMSLPVESLEKIVAAFREYLKKRDNEEKNHNSDRKNLAEFVGIHLEGPFLNPEKCGAQKKTFIINPVGKILSDLQNLSGGLIRLVTIAPELEGAMEIIKSLHGRIHFSIGHSLCDYETAQKAFAEGADHVTHIFNAMSSFSHRLPGIVGAAFDDPDCFVELICDGIHVAPSMVRAVFKLFGDDRVILISDSMEAAGMPDGTYRLGGQTVSVHEKAARLEDGTIAGSTSTLYDCLKNSIKMGIPLESALKAVTINPCRSIGLDKEYGSIDIGMKNNLLLLSAKDLSLKKVI